MKNTIYLMLLMIAFVSCKKEDSGGLGKDSSIRVEEITLSSNKTSLIADNKDEIKIDYKIKTNIGLLFTHDKLRITANGIPLNEAKFKTNTKGTYEIVATLNNIKSNTIKVVANENLIGVPHKIELGFKNKIINNLASIYIDNIDFVEWEVKIYDIQNNLLDVPYQTFVNEKPHSGKLFKTTEEGTYEISVSAGGITSNKIKVVANDWAERYVTINSSRIQSKNSVGKVTVSIDLKNISDKRLKYIGFTTTFYNAVGDVVKEEITGNSSYTFNGVGFFEPNTSRFVSYELGYYTLASSVKTKLYSVTLENDKRIFARY